MSMYENAAHVSTSSRALLPNCFCGVRITSGEEIRILEKKWHSNCRLLLQIHWKDLKCACVLLVPQRFVQRVRSRKWDMKSPCARYYSYGHIFVCNPQRKPAPLPNNIFPSMIIPSLILNADSQVYSYIVVNSMQLSSTVLETHVYTNCSWHQWQTVIDFRSAGPCILVRTTSNESFIRGSCSTRTMWRFPDT